MIDDLREMLLYEGTTESVHAQQAGREDGQREAWDAWRKQGYAGLHELRARRLDLESKLDKYGFQHDALTALREMHEHLGSFLGVDDGPPLELKFEKIQTSRIPKFIAALQADRVAYVGNKEFLREAPRNATIKLAQECEKIIVNGSYKSMIANKSELVDAEWHSPYNLNSFEFHLKGNGRFIYFVIFMCDVDDLREFSVVVNIRKGKRDLWALVSRSPDEDDYPLVPVLKEEIRAICILLDADVIVQKQHRVAARFNDQKRQSKDLPEYEFKTISLRKAVRYEGEQIINEEKRCSPRLHLRRGHWRRVGSYKTWVRWSVVGDASLGVVDKQYRI